ncbi:hypothetical protein JYB32_20375 [Burkholderia cenocepacia]|uniref:hypothetical protein n=1 Tax=Burkholderia cenocepacia TaxID=95486 RepID=UPI00196AD84D|nr:hypothetical protein [Burkholderia cenocepacia]MBN3531705.1 hypothetical protein [Burkholderia cenocepacia]
MRHVKKFRGDPRVPRSFASEVISISGRRFKDAGKQQHRSFPFDMASDRISRATIRHGIVRLRRRTDIPEPKVTLRLLLGSNHRQIDDWKAETLFRPAGRVGNPRAPVAPFSDEWRAREEMKRRLYDAPDEPDPGSDKATKLPEFQRLSWAELRDAWSATTFKKNRLPTLEQRFVLEVVHVRRTLRLMEKMVCAAELELKKNGYPDSFALDQLRRMIDGARFD